MIHLKALGIFVALCAVSALIAGPILLWGARAFAVEILVIAVAFVAVLCYSLASEL